MLPCPHAGTCAGCPWIERTRASQHRERIARFHALWRARDLPEPIPEINLLDLGPGGLRDRADLTLHREGERTHLGLWNLDHDQILDLEVCPQMSPPLSRWHADFRRDHLPQVQFGNIRLRVAPDGTRGIWLDFPNRLIESLLSEQTWLEGLARAAKVEIGQRRHSLIASGKGLSLAEPIAYPWFETYDRGGTALPLYCQVASFTQPGFRANRALVDLVRMATRASGAESWLELGAGIGNFSLPLAELGARVTAIETDARAVACLERSARETELASRITTARHNIHHASRALGDLLERHDAVLADPPRSGLGRFIDLLDRRKGPAGFVYVSCYAETLTADLVGLYRAGYRAGAVTCLDQFPQSIHAEWVVPMIR